MTHDCVDEAAPMRSRTWPTPWRPPTGRQPPAPGRLLRRRRLPGAAPAGRRCGGSPRSSGCAGCTPTLRSAPARLDRRRRRATTTCRPHGRQARSAVAWRGVSGYVRSTGSALGSSPRPTPAVIVDGAGRGRASTEPIVVTLHRQRDRGRDGRAHRDRRRSRSPRRRCVLVHEGSATYGQRRVVLVGDGAQLTVVVRPGLGRRRRPPASTPRRSAATPRSRTSR